MLAEPALFQGIVKVCTQSGKGMTCLGIPAPFQNSSALAD